MLIPQIGTAALGLYQTIASTMALNKLNKTPQPNYEISPELQGSYKTAMERAAYGYNPAQRGNFMNNVTSSQNAAYQRAVDMSGGQMSSAIGRVLQSNKLQALNRFAADNATKQQINQQYADSLGQRISDQRNRKTQTEIQRRMMLEQALGTAKSQGITNIASAFNANAALGTGANGMMSLGDGTQARGVSQSYDINQNSPLYNTPDYSGNPVYGQADPTFYNGTEYIPTQTNRSYYRGY